MFDKQCTDTDRQIMWALSRRFGSGCWLLWRLFLDIIWSITSCRLRADKNTYVGPGIHNFWHGGSHFSLIAEKFNVSRVILTPAWSLPVQAASPPIQLVHIVILHWMYSATGIALWCSGSMSRLLLLDEGYRQYDFRLVKGYFICVCLLYHQLFGFYLIIASLGINQCLTSGRGLAWQRAGSGPGLLRKHPQSRRIQVNFFHNLLIKIFKMLRTFRMFRMSLFKLIWGSNVTN